MSARPIVMLIAEALRDADLEPPSFASLFDSSVAAAAADLGAQLLESCRERMGELLEDAAAQACEDLSATLAGRARQRERAHTTSRELGEALIQPAGGEDPEWEPTMSGLQRGLSELVDAERAAALEARLCSQQRWPDVRRLH